MSNLLTKAFISGCQTPIMQNKHTCKCFAQQKKKNLARRVYIKYPFWKKKYRAIFFSQKVSFCCKMNTRNGTGIVFIGKYFSDNTQHIWDKKGLFRYKHPIYQRVVYRKLCNNYEHQGSDYARMCMFKNYDIHGNRDPYMKDHHLPAPYVICFVEEDTFETDPAKRLQQIQQIVFLMISYKGTLSCDKVYVVDPFYQLPCFTAQKFEMIRNFDDFTHKLKMEKMGNIWNKLARRAFQKQFLLNLGDRQRVGLILYTGTEYVDLLVAFEFFLVREFHGTKFTKNNNVFYCIPFDNAILIVPIVFDILQNFNDTADTLVNDPHIHTHYNMFVPLCDDARDIIKEVNNSTFPLICSFPTAIEDIDQHVKIPTTKVSRDILEQIFLNMLKRDLLTVRQHH